MAILAVFHNDYTQIGVYSKVIRYVLNPEKAKYTGSVNIYREDELDAIAEQMIEMTIAYGVLGGQLLRHFSLSFDTLKTEAWVTPEIAYQIGNLICQKILYRHQVVFGVHIDAEHVHIHFVVNAVDYQGNKFIDKQSTYKQLAKDIKRLPVQTDAGNSRIYCDLVYRNNPTYTNETADKSR